AFTAIANNQPELLKDANALAAVTQSAIMLAQASKMELKPAGEALTQILNKFGKGAKDAAKTIDILAAGSVAGSSEIMDTAAAIQEFGTVAANAGIKINESVALIELASKFDKGTEAGTRLRNILLMMSTAKVQDPKAIADMKRLGVNMNIVSNSALPLNTRLLEMSKIAKDNAALFHVFGKENQALATGVLSTAGNFQSMIDAVETQGMAAKMAAKNNDTLAVSITQLKAAWVNMLTSSDKANVSLRFVKGTIRFITDNLGLLVGILGSLIIAWAAWWTWIKIMRGALIAFNIVQGITIALQGGSALAFTAGSIGYKAYRFAVVTATAAQWLLNAALTANPIGLIIVGIAAL
ncbi:MAG TPA: phage tail tape measure protein, partial [Gammaproteobacteria bacterium]|nr:phage tail tape measure protein [Gammaproteobacteria bacterium]